MKGKWMILIIVVVLAGLLFYKHFVVDQTKDKGSMENPDIIAVENKDE